MTNSNNSNGSPPNSNPSPAPTSHSIWANTGTYTIPNVVSVSGTITTGGQITWYPITYVSPSINGDLSGDYSAPQPASPPKQPKVKHGNEEGYECTRCADFFPMAELNMPEDVAVDDRVSFACYACRKGLK
jgi:hypothetical protein